MVEDAIWNNSDKQLVSIYLIMIPYLIERINNTHFE